MTTEAQKGRRFNPKIYKKAKRSIVSESLSDPTLIIGWSLYKKCLKMGTGRHNLNKIYINSNVVS